MTEKPGTYDVVRGNSSQIQAELRIQAETKEEIDAIIQRLLRSRRSNRSSNGI